MGWARGGPGASQPDLPPPVSSLTSFPEVVDLSFFFSVPEDLSLEEREELLDIRRRKKELIDDIEVNSDSRVS